MYNYQKIHVNIFIKRQKRWGLVGVFGGVGEDGGLCQISIHKSLAILFILYVFYRPMYMYLTKTPEQILGSEYIEKTSSNDQ